MVRVEPAVVEVARFLSSVGQFRVVEGWRETRQSKRPRNKSKGRMRRGLK